MWHAGIRVWFFFVIIVGFGIKNSVPASLRPAFYSASMAHVRQPGLDSGSRQSRPDFGLGFQVDVLTKLQGVPSSLGGKVFPSSLYLSLSLALSRSLSVSLSLSLYVPAFRFRV